jgi:hypothetical protein
MKMVSRRRILPALCGVLVSLGASGVGAQVTPDPVLRPGAVQTDPALSPDQTDPAPVRRPGAVQNDPALSPEQTNPSPMLSPVPSDSRTPLPQIFPNQN